MRRMILLAMGMGLLAVGVGCHHVAGVCDCCDGQPVTAQHAESLSPGGPIGGPVIQGEPIKVAPRPLGNGPEPK